MTWVNDGRFVRPGDSGTLGPTDKQIGNVSVDLVLGLSITSAAIRFVLVEGATGEGATVDTGALDFTTSGRAANGAASELIDAVMGEGPFAAAPGVRPLSVGVTWSGDAAIEGAILLEKLAAKGADNVVAVSAAEAAAALANGIASMSGREDVAVCVVEPDAAVVAVVGPDAVHAENVGRTSGAAEVASTLAAVLADRAPDADAVFVLGSAEDLDDVVARLEQAVPNGVITAAEADLVLARGAGLVSAHGLPGGHADIDFADVDAPQRDRWKVPALTSVVVAAVLTFVVSLSVALGLRLTPETRSESAGTRPVANAAPQPLAKAPVFEEALPAAPPPEAGPPPAEAPPAPESLPAPEPEAPPVESAPEASAPAPDVAPVSQPAFDPPEAAPAAPPPVDVPAYVPPAPAYVPPPDPANLAPTAPGYVTPVDTPQPRLRDKIIERIPILNRFHQPG
jgi:hypothetical protein